MKTCIHREEEKVNAKRYTNNLKVVPVDGNYLYRIVNWQEFIPHDRNKNRDGCVFISNGNVYATWDKLRSLVNKNLPFSSAFNDIIVVEENEDAQDFSRQVFLTTIEQDLFLHKTCEDLAEKHNFNYFNITKKYNSHSIEFSLKAPAVFDPNPFLMKMPTSKQSLVVEIDVNAGLFVSQCVFYSEEDKQLHLKEAVDRLVVNQVEERLKTLESREEQ